jgi:chromosome partitioning protein
MRILSLCTVKGGVGKTMINYQVSGALSALNYKILCIDVDPQHNLSSAFLEEDYTNSLIDVLNDECTIKDVIIKPYPDDDILKNIDLIPCNYDLFYFDGDNASNKYLKLKQVLNNSDLDYDFVLIDTNPAINILTANVLSCSDKVIGVLDNSLDSIKGFQYLENTIMKDIKESINPNLDVLGIVLNNSDSRSKIGTTTMKTIVRLYGDKLFDTDISASIKNKESRTAKQPLVVYEPKHKSTLQFINLTNEILERLGVKNG